MHFTLGATGSETRFFPKKRVSRLNCYPNLPQALEREVFQVLRVRPKFIGGPVSIPAFGQRRVRNPPYPLLREVFSVKKTGAHVPLNASITFIVLRMINKSSTSD